MKLIVGLGNPGPRYSRTRHNAGFLVVDELARRHALTFRKGKAAEEARLERPAGPVTLMKPLTFMNRSGAAVQAYMTRGGIKPEAVLVIHDDLDLPLGRLRLKTGGGAGGQRGVADTAQRVGPDFHRLKVGISRPPEGWSAEGWVLSRFQEEEGALLSKVVDAAADAVEGVLSEGLEQAMNRVNGLDLRLRDAPPTPTLEPPEP